MDKELFLEQVISQLKEASSVCLSEEDWIQTRNFISISLYRDGFSVRDAVKFLLLSEEFNPDLNEEVALRKMAALREKYMKV